MPKEALGPLYCRNKVENNADNDFSDKNLNLLRLKFPLCIWQDFLCIMKVTGAMWIMSLWGGSLCF